MINNQVLSIFYGKISTSKGEDRNLSSPFDLSSSFFYGISGFQQPHAIKTETFKKQYAHRAWTEGTFSPGVRAFDLRRTRYLGLAKIHLQHILVACAINLARLIRWIQGEVPSQTHATAFTRLFQAFPA